MASQTGKRHGAAQEMVTNEKGNANAGNAKIN